MMIFSLKEKGQGLVEYALILVLIAVAVILIMTTVGEQIFNGFSTISSTIGAHGY